MNNFKSFTCFESAYKDLLTLVLEHGHERKVRGFVTREISPILLTTDRPLNNILNNKVRKTNKTFAIAEFLWMLSGSNRLDVVAHYNKNITNYSDDGETLSGAYGPKIQSQLQYVFETLTNDHGSRQAVLTLWERNPGQTKDVPCTLSMQFIINHGKLDLIVNMRSNDLWLGLPYDFYSFTMIQNYVAFLLDLEIGRYSHLAGSLHLYEEHFDVAREAAKGHTTFGQVLYSDRIVTDELAKTILLEKELRELGMTESVLQREPWVTMESYLRAHLKNRQQKDVQAKKTVV